MTELLPHPQFTVGVEGGDRRAGGALVAEGRRSLSVGDGGRGALEAEGGGR
jgi:hypothetical protein